VFFRRLATAWPLARWWERRPGWYLAVPIRCIRVLNAIAVNYSDIVERTGSGQPNSDQREAREIRHSSLVKEIPRKVSRRAASGSGSRARSRVSLHLLETLVAGRTSRGLRSVFCAPAKMPTYCACENRTLDQSGEHVCSAKLVCSLPVEEDNLTKATRQYSSPVR